MLALILLITGIIFRFIPHTANFTPILAIALFGGAYLNKKYALLMPLVLMMLTDIFLGSHNAILFTWGSILLISGLGMLLRKRKTVANVTLSALSSAVLFFIITNFGVWIMGWYPKTLNGLVSCFTLAIPFFRTSIISTLVFSFGLFGIYEVVARKVKDTPL
ncbi:MAG: LPXTG cell wall anchor domain-containing protein, partial [Candidatus Omnitrophica bacterium]|nr:LPXTG cell wall anchor domain-containing protein [Candidatus Omnitrophota bacterium]